MLIDDFETSYLHFKMINLKGKKMVEKEGYLQKAKIADGGKKLRKNWSTSWIVLSNQKIEFYKESKQQALSNMPKNPSCPSRKLELFQIQRSSSTELLNHYDSDIKEQKPEHRKSLKKPDNNARIETIKYLVQKLPPPNRDTMKVLFGHLTRVVAGASKNLMSTQSLGIVFGPTLLRAENEAGNMAIHMVYQNQIAELMLSKYSEIFGSGRLRQTRQVTEYVHICLDA
ncbi:Rho GTPase-activating protein 15 [Heterocephalus glaber]|uniref:Rho GTPase-activating protein 15 n=1 Tax=Heterocephalus glaber TaxID=10181 RepID=G5BFA7_HETGA|nr:Rho GTPase-activating protein 15 [Heterocephalus glaber]